MWGGCGSLGECVTLGSSSWGSVLGASSSRDSTIHCRCSEVCPSWAVVPLYLNPVSLITAETSRKSSCLCWALSTWGRVLSLFRVGTCHTYQLDLSFGVIQKENTKRLTQTVYVSLPERKVLGLSHGDGCHGIHSRRQAQTCLSIAPSSRLTRVPEFRTGVWRSCPAGF